MAHRKKIELILMNLICGSAVLISYVHGLLNNPSAGGPSGAMFRNGSCHSTPSMLSAAAGYLLFTFFILIRINPDEAVFARRYRYRFFNARARTKRNVM